MRQTYFRCALLLTIGASLPLTGALAASTTSLATTQTAHAVAGASETRFEAFDRAFKFATGIVSDAKDRGKAQESVVADLIAAGALDAAAAKADTIEDWRRGTSYADIAATYARAGQLDQARAFIDKAETVRGTVTGWQNPRIEMHISEARAAASDPAAASEAATRIAADDDQYIGRSAAAVATAKAASGDFDAGMKTLEALDPELDYERAWYRTAGYLGLARTARFTRDQRSRAFDAAIHSALGIPGWQKAEMLEDIADALRAYGDPARAVIALDGADKALTEVDAGVSTKAALLAHLAAGYARAGRADRAQQLLAQAPKSLASAMTTETPSLLASIAEGWYAAGDRSEAATSYDAALRSAESLVNARPRALAMVSILRSMGRDSYPMDAQLRTRVAAALAGLKAPW